MSKTPFQPRFGSPVVITALANETASSFSAQGSLLRSDGRMLTVTTTAQLRAGTPVRLDVDGGLVLGEIIASELAEGQAQISVEVDQVIPSLSDLANLVRNLMMNVSPDRATADAARRPSHREAG